MSSTFMPPGAYAGMPVPIEGIADVWPGLGPRAPLPGFGAPAGPALSKRGNGASKLSLMEPSLAGISF